MGHASVLPVALRLRLRWRHGPEPGRPTAHEPAAPGRAPDGYPGSGDPGTQTADRRHEGEETVILLGCDWQPPLLARASHSCSCRACPEIARGVTRPGTLGVREVAGPREYRSGLFSNWGIPPERRAFNRCASNFLNYI